MSLIYRRQVASWTLSLNSRIMPGFVYSTKQIIVIGAFCTLPGQAGIAIFRAKRTSSSSADVSNKYIDD
jgi:hypothetical protein